MRMILIIQMARRRCHGPEKSCSYDLYHSLRIAARIKYHVTSMNIEKREITKELQESYIDYAMSVIISRALPDIQHEAGAPPRSVDHVGIGPAIQRAATGSP